MDRRMFYHTRDHIEAPNWSRDGKYFVFNRGGRICKLPVTGSPPETLDTGDQIRLQQRSRPFAGRKAAGHQVDKDGKWRVYVLPVSSGKPRRVAPLAPSYWHGWSPDGKTLASVRRGGNFDIYTMRSGREGEAANDRADRTMARIIRRMENTFTSTPNAPV